MGVEEPEDNLVEAEEEVPELDNEEEDLAEVSDDDAEDDNLAQEDAEEQETDENGRVIIVRRHRHWHHYKTFAHTSHGKTMYKWRRSGTWTQRKKCSKHYRYSHHHLRSYYRY